MTATRPSTPRTPTRRATRRAAFTAAAVAACAALTACRAGGSASEADRLRAQLIETEKSLAAAIAERNEAAARLAEAERVRLTGSGDLPAEVAAAIPRCAGIEIDRLSGPATAGDAIDFYIRPFDGRRRFVQVAGRLTLRADLIPDDPDQQPRLIASAAFAPTDLREAYRSGFTGTHYSFRLPVPPPGLPSRGTLTLTAEFADAITGRVHRAEATRTLHR